jgi:hypothetical protein
MRDFLPVVCETDRDDEKISNKPASIASETVDDTDIPKEASLEKLVPMVFEYAQPPVVLANVPSHLKTTE